MIFIRYFLTLLMFSVANKNVAAGSLFPASFSTSFPSLLLRHIRYKIFIQVLHPTHYIIIKGLVFLKWYTCFQLTAVIFDYANVYCIFS